MQFGVLGKFVASTEKLRAFVMQMKGNCYLCYIVLLLTFKLVLMAFLCQCERLYGDVCDLKFKIETFFSFLFLNVQKAKNNLVYCDP